MPEIDCKRCEEGSLQLRRAVYGYVVIGLAAFCVLVFIALVLIRRYKKDLYARILELKDRQVENLNNVIASGRREKQEQLQRLQPKLELIAERVASQSQDGGRRKQPLLSVSKDGQITFQTGRLFDQLDANRNGSLSYDEINAVLLLDPPQLHEFVTRMNELGGGSPHSTEVSRLSFAKHFLDALDETSHFKPTKEEAAMLFDSIAKRGTNRDGTVEPEKFYSSPLAEFLSDSQINDLLARLRRLKTPDHHKERSFLGTSFIQPIMFWKGDTAAPDGDRISRAISRAEFVEHYPELLPQVIYNPDPMPMSFIGSSLRLPHGNAEEEQLDAIDIAFEDLSLAVRVGDDEIKVVDNVTGRLEARTMTAILGGSGAGKTSLLNALCGRAHYGTVSGKVKVNGHDTSIEAHRNIIGFVPQVGRPQRLDHHSTIPVPHSPSVCSDSAGPCQHSQTMCEQILGSVARKQNLHSSTFNISSPHALLSSSLQDDIVYAELTVKENLMYSGRFQLPAGTPLDEIEDLADATLASLGLSRVANSIVGDVTRRGVSGGERKRVNIGVSLAGNRTIREQVRKQISPPEPLLARSLNLCRVPRQSSLTNPHPV